MGAKRLIAWVRSGALEGGPELIRELGGDPAEIARRAGVPRKAFYDPEFPIQLAAAARYLEVAAEVCRCDTFGLRLAQKQGLSLFGPLWPLFRSSETIGKLLQDLAEYFPLHTQGALVGLVKAQGGVLVSYELAARAAKARRQVVELSIGVLVRELRRHLSRWRPSEIYIRHAPPSDPRVHRQLLGDALHFNADRNAVFVEDELLSRPTVSGDSKQHGVLAPGFDSARLRLPRAVALRAETVVRGLLPFAPCTLTTTARMMRITPRTLQRRLAAQATSFDEILDEVRADLAESFLSDSDLPVAAVAEILQYSETSALSRAYRRWYGMNPRAARQT